MKKNNVYFYKNLRDVDNVSNLISLSNEIEDKIKYKVEQGKFNYKDNRFIYIDSILTNEIGIFTIILIKRYDIKSDSLDKINEEIEKLKREFESLPVSKISLSIDDGKLILSIQAQTLYYGDLLDNSSKNNSGIIKAMLDVILIIKSRVDIFSQKNLEWDKGEICGGL